MPKQIIVSGHTLPREGQLRVAAGVRGRNGGGFTKCSCGEESPVLNSTAARQRWHRQHKLDVIAAREELEGRMMPLDEFVKEGLLQEVNRLFFHPRGLALTFERDKITGKNVRIKGIQTCGDDPEGFVFTNWEPEDYERRDKVEDRHMRYARARLHKLGFDVQGVGVIS